MDREIKYRVLKEANFILKTKKTIRELAKQFKVSKSTVHVDLTARISKINKKMANEIKKILTNHNEIKHLRGGKATKEKYKRGKNNESKQSIIFNR